MGEIERVQAKGKLLSEELTHANKKKSVHEQNKAATESCKDSIKADFDLTKTRLNSRRTSQAGTIQNKPKTDKVVKPKKENSNQSTRFLLTILLMLLISIMRTPEQLSS